MQLSEAPRAAPRVPFISEIEIRFEDFSDFVTAYSGNISTTGIFIQTVRPQPPGSMLQFEFEVEGGMRLIRGAGEVVWTRQRGESGQLPPGMGVRFVSLDTETRKMIRWLIEQRGGEEALDQPIP